MALTVSVLELGVAMAAIALALPARGLDAGATFAVMVLGLDAGTTFGLPARGADAGATFATTAFFGVACGHARSFAVSALGEDGLREAACGQLVLGEIGEVLYQLERLGRLLGVNNLDGEARMHEDVIANVRAGREPQGRPRAGRRACRPCRARLDAGKVFCREQRGTCQPPGVVLSV